jgi:hypothetical protein
MVLNDGLSDQISPTQDGPLSVGRLNLHTFVAVFGRTTLEVVTVYRLPRVAVKYS